MKTRHFETLQLHAGQEHADPTTGARAVPIYTTTAYVFDSCEQAAARFSLEEGGNIYSRLTNNTQEVLEKRMAILEGGVAALALASGAAAITYTLQALAQGGGHIVAQKSIYGGSYNLLAHTLPQFGISSTFVDIHNEQETENAIRPETRAFYAESMGNPNCDIPDIAKLAALAHKHGIPLIIDNTFATPYLLRPIEHGADIVVHSATKFIGGHGTTLGGIVVDSGRFDWRISDKFKAFTASTPAYHGVSFTDAAGEAAFATYLRAIMLRDMGACISPFAAFQLLQGIETLSLRMERHGSNAVAVVKYLSEHPQVVTVNHPVITTHPHHKLYKQYFPHGGGSIFTFEIRGGKEAAFRFINSLQLFSLVANVADMKSLVIHPATTTHSQMTTEEQLACGITPGTIRISVGTEHTDDIIDDLNQAFEQVGEEASPIIK